MVAAVNSAATLIASRYGDMPDSARRVVREYLSR
jgi:hypothetical protein